MELPGLPGAPGKLAGSRLRAHALSQNWAF